MPALAQSSTTASGQASGSGSSTFGQSSTSTGKSKSGHAGHGTTASDQGSASTASTAGAAKVSAADHRFVMEAPRGGLAAGELGKLAAQKGSNADVKSFGQMMVDDHTKANDELKSLAASKGITVPSDLDAAAKA